MGLCDRFSHLNDYKPVYRDFRAGDVMHSLADVSKAENLLGYSPTHRIEEGINIALGWYVNNITGHQL